MVLLDQHACGRERAGQHALLAAQDHKVHREGNLSLSIYLSIYVSIYLSVYPQIREMLPPEEDLQTYKRSLVRFHNIMPLVLELIADKLQHSTPKFSLEEYLFIY